MAARFATPVVSPSFSTVSASTRPVYHPINTSTLRPPSIPILATPPLTARDGESDYKFPIKGGLDIGDSACKNSDKVAKIRSHNPRPTLKISLATPSEEIDDVTRAFSLLVTKFNNYVDFSDTNVIDSTRSYNHELFSHDSSAESEHLARTLKSCKQRVPTPYSPFMTEWLSHSLNNKQGAMTATSPGSTSMDNEGDSEIQEMREAEVRKNLRSCRGRVATPYNPFKSSWL